MVVSSGLWIAAVPAHAQDATWLSSPGSVDYSTNANWDTGFEPSGTAFFGTSNTTSLSFAEMLPTIGGWTFNVGASNYTFTTSSSQHLYFTGAGIVINGGSATIVNDGSLDFDNASTAGGSNITNNGHIYFTDTATAGTGTITNNLEINFLNSSSAGSATFINGGEIDFTNTSTGGSANFTNNGTLNFRDTSTAGTGTITNFANLYFSNPDGSTGITSITNSGYLYFSGTATAGSAVIGNSGYMYFYGSSTAGGTTITNGNALYFYDSSSAGTATITTDTGGDLEFYSTSTASSASIVNSGGLGFNDASTAASAVITNNDIVVFSSNSTAGSATITTNSGASTYLENSSSGGTARFITNAGGTFSMVNLSSAGTTAGSIEGAGSYNLGAKQLTTGSNNLSTEVSGVISGTGGSLVKTGTGTLILSGNDSYTGATAVNGGALVVNGSIASSSSVDMQSGSTLGGIGTVAATTIENGATLAPGNNSIGTLTVAGNLAFSTASTYLIEVSPSAADRTTVLGTASLTGATVDAVALPGSFRGQTYTILSATGGLGGTQFGGLVVTGSFAPARNPRLAYDADDVYLVLDPGLIQLPSAVNGNQSAVAGVINNAVLNGGVPPAAFDALLNMTGGQLTNALSQASGQPGASTAQTGFVATRQFINGVFNGAFGDGAEQGYIGQGEALGFVQDNSQANADASKPQLSPEVKNAYAAVTPRDRQASSFDARWNVWASAYGGNSRTSGDANAGTSTTTSRIAGTIAGASYNFSDTLAGFALGGAGSRFDIANGFGGGRADVFNAAVYAKHTIGAAYVAGLIGYSWQDTTTDRIVTIAGADVLHASFKAQALASRLEGGWRTSTSIIGITPYAALQATTFYLPSYGETAASGSNTFALSYASKTITATRSELGAKFDRAIPVEGGLFTLKAKTAWAHDWNTDRSAIATFQSLPGATFTTNGAQPSANAALASVGGEMDWHDGWSVAANFDGEFSRATDGYAGKGSVKYAW